MNTYWTDNIKGSRGYPSDREIVLLNDHAAAIEAKDAQLKEANAEANELALTCIAKDAEIERLNKYHDDVMHDQEISFDSLRAIIAEKDRRIAELEQKLESITIDCETCGGQGWYPDMVQGFHGDAEPVQVQCHNCNGTGQVAAYSEITKLRTELATAREEITEMAERCFDLREQLEASQKQAAQHADAAEAPAGLERLGVHWSLYRNANYKDGRCWVVYNNRTGRNHRAATALAAVRKAEEAGK